MNLEFTRWRTPADAEQALARLLPTGTPQAEVEDMMRQAGASCVEDRGGLLCSLDQPGDGTVYVAWRISFGFDETNRLQRFGVSRGLMGP